MSIGYLSLPVIGLLLALLPSTGHMPAPQEQTQSQPTGVPRAVLTVNSYDFGDVYRGEVISQVFIIRNAGNADLVIKELMATCSCEFVDSDKIIPPGKEGRAVIEVNTNGLSGQVSRSATMRTNDPNLTSTNLTLTANVLTGATGGAVDNVVLRQGRHVGPLFVGPHTRYGFRATTKVSSKFEFLISVERGTVNLSKVTTDSTHVTCHIETVKPGKQYKVVVESVPVDKPGRFDNTMIVYTDSAQLPWFPLYLNLNVSSSP